MTSNETLSNQNGERIELSNSETAEHYDRLSLEREKGVERINEEQERSAESARNEIEKMSVERESRKHDNIIEHRVEGKADSKKARKKAYNAIMEQTRAEMSAPQRAFSRVIHNPIVENASNFAANTIARPDAILSGAVSAFLLTLVIYLIAKQGGYPLTGTETIAAFIIGWLLGNIYDFAKTMMRGGR